MTKEQSQMFELLCIFKEMCKAHKLQYYLTGGTLLGAVRHQGFIPWDDDIDVSMPLEDFQIFQQLSSELPTHIEIQSEKNDSRYPFVFLKLCDIRYPFHTGYSNEPKGIYIDIFPLIPSKKLSRRIKLRFEAISVINYVLQVKMNWTSFIPYKLPQARLGFWLLSYFSLIQLQNLRRKQISKLYEPNGKEVLCSPGGVYKAEKEFFPAEWYSKTTDLIFEGQYFSAPIGWQEYLTRNYGNYMELPAPENQKSHHK